MTKSVPKLLLCCALSLISLGVSADDERSVSAREVFPVTDNLNWHYDIAIVAGKNVRSAPYVVRCRKRGEFQGQPAYIFRTRFLSGRRRKETLQREFYSFNKQGDLICYKRENGPIEVPLTPPQIILKSQLKVGQKWSWKGLFRKQKGESSYHVLRFETLKLGEQSYDCVVVEALSETFGEKKNKQRRLFWFARGVGLVKEQSTIVGSKVEVVGELKNLIKPQADDKK